MFADRCLSNLFGANALQLLELGARVRMSIRCIHFALSGVCPDREVFAAIWMNHAPG